MIRYMYYNGCIENTLMNTTGQDFSGGGGGGGGGKERRERCGGGEGSVYFPWCCGANDQ